MKVLVFGSCVSRDIFEAPNCCFLVGQYLARSSFASAFSGKKALDNFSINLESGFQRRMVSCDFSKSAWFFLEGDSFDGVLVDFIDERFDLFQFDDGAICTLSSELLGSGFEPAKLKGRIIKSGSDEFLSLWNKGWDRFVDLMSRVGLLDRVYINRVFWAGVTEDGEDFSDTYTDARIQQSNIFLSKLYSRVSQDIPLRNFLVFPQELLIGGKQHRWGKSPFHYIDKYYETAFSQLYEAMTREDKENSDISLLLVDKSPLFWRTYVSSPRGWHNESLLSECRVSGNCVPSKEGDYITYKFSQNVDAHRVRFHMPVSFRANGISVRLRVRNWEVIRYVALGYMDGEKYTHIKVVNFLSDQWAEIVLQHEDIAFGIQNKWEHPAPVDISEIVIYLRGRAPEEGAELDVDYFILWESSVVSRPGQYTCGIPSCYPARLPVDEIFLNTLYEYTKKSLSNIDEQAENFLRKGVCPLIGGAVLDWSLDEVLPAKLSSVGTYSFSWHALHPAAILLVYANQREDEAALYAAREFVSDWLDRSFFSVDNDQKYAWYDHGTAERQLTLILLWAEGVKRRFDKRFMDRLGVALVRHAELLESEMFYASHQRTRYHNHAWFQDLALLASSIALSDYPASGRWFTRSVDRLTDQFQKLIVRDQGFSVFVENSIGYHNGVQRLVEFAAALVEIKGVDSDIPQMAKELAGFSSYLLYPDGRAPGQGDTFRRANAEDFRARNQATYSSPEALVLSKAGYGLVKGNFDGVPFMICLFATSLCATHKHEDNLSFTLFFDGIEWLVDPSFFSHEYDATIPAYLRSAAAHNCVFIPNVSYSIEPGKAQLWGEVHKPEFIFEGRHTAYEGFVVSRRLEGACDVLKLAVRESVECSEGNESNVSPRVMFHFGEGVIPRIDGNHVFLRHEHSDFEISIFFSRADLILYHGEVVDGLVRGVSGTGFMQTTEIWTLECVLPEVGDFEWMLEARVCERNL